MTIKSISLLALAVTLLAGCASNHFSEARGQSVVNGKGGSVRTVKGIDIWDIGEPDRKFQIIGFIQQDMVQNNANFIARSINNSISESTLVSEAKKRGGDAIVFVSSASQLAGAYAFDNGSVAVKTLAQKQVAVVRYIK